MPVPLPSSSLPDFCVPLCDAVRDNRQLLGITQAELARRVGGGMSARHVHRMETSIAWMPSWIRLQQIALALEMPMDAFLGGCIADETVSEAVAHVGDSCANDPVRHQLP